MIKLRPDWRGTGSLSTLGLEVALSIVLPLVAGTWADGRWGTTPWLALTGFGLGWVLKTFGWDGIAAHGHQPAHAWVWVGAIIPFSLVGAWIMTRIWTARAGSAAH